MDSNNNVLGVNIDANSVISQNERETFVPRRNKTEFNPKNYLNARLVNGETSKKLTIRLLPFSPEGGSPFFKVHLHTLKIKKENGSSWKTFMCPVKNNKGDKCPFCELSEQARQMRYNATNEVEKKKYGDIEFMYRAKEAWICRVIDRDHEEDGVKFWLFNASRKKDGVYDKIINIFNNRWEEAKKVGKELNIFDLNAGKDLTVTLTKDSNNKTVIQITDASFITPLSNDYNQAKGWIEDQKKWDEVYTIKSYDYMSIIAQGGIPVFDKEQQKYVDKEELDKKNEKAREEEIKENYTEQKKDFSKFVEDIENEQPQAQPKESNIFMTEDELPY